MAHTSGIRHGQLVLLTCLAMPSGNDGVVAWGGGDTIQRQIERRRRFAEKLRVAFDRHQVSVVEAEPGRLGDRPVWTLTISRADGAVLSVRVQLLAESDPLDLTMVDPIVDTVARYLLRQHGT